MIVSCEANSAASGLREFRDRAERGFVLRMSRQNHGNISRAAVDLGITKKDWLG